MLCSNARNRDLEQELHSAYTGFVKNITCITILYVILLLLLTKNVE